MNGASSSRANTFGYHRRPTEVGIIEDLKGVKDHSLGPGCLANRYHPRSPFQISFGMPGIRCHRALQHREQLQRYYLCQTKKPRVLECSSRMLVEWVKLIHLQNT